MDSETDNNEYTEKSASINDFLQNSRTKIDKIADSFNAVKNIALQSITNNVGNQTTSRDLDALSSNGYTNHSEDIGPKFDPHLLKFRHMICSEDVTKKRLCSRDENTQILFDKSDIDDEEDETFYENLKKRITDDIKNKLLNNSEAPLPKRSMTVKKRKSAFNNESLNLMKRCRAQDLGRLEKSSSNTENGIFVLENKPNIENQENIVASTTLKESETFLLLKKSASQIAIQNFQNYANNCANRDDNDNDS